MFEKDLVVSRGNPIKVSVTRYNGELTIDVRHQYRDRDTDELKPTKKGINILAVDLPALIAELQEAQKAIQEGV